MTATSNKRTIYSDAYYRVKTKHSSVYCSCKTHLPMRTVAYAKESITGNEIYCKECIPALRNALKRRAHITAQAITGTKPYAASKIALPSINGCQIRMCIIIKTVNTNMTVKEMMNLWRA